MIRNSACTGALLLAMSVVGCSGSQLASVHGKVTLKNGTPVKGASVNFDNVDLHVKAWGITGNDGTYSLMSLKPGDGARPGTYHVSVHQPLPADSRLGITPPPFQARYQSFDKSGLVYTVKPGDNTFDMSLDKREP